MGFRPMATVYQFDVYNDGIGLSPEQLEKVFDKFVRFRAVNEKDTKGTGLGLFITRDIILKHGG